MDFLNNIWVAISTPNETLFNVMAVPLSFIESTLVIYLAVYLLNLKVNKKQILAYIISLSIEGLLTLYLVPAPYNSFLNYMISICLAHFIFKILPTKLIINMF